jgi:hypothetical protein
MAAPPPPPPLRLVASPAASTAEATELPAPPCTLGALARILDIETLDLGAVPSGTKQKSGACMAHVSALDVLFGRLTRARGFALAAALAGLWRAGDPGGRRADVFRGHNLREGTYSPRVFGGQARARTALPRLSRGSPLVPHALPPRRHAADAPPRARARSRARAAHRPGARRRHAHGASHAARAQARSAPLLFFCFFRKQVLLWR